MGTDADKGTDNRSRFQLRGVILWLTAFLSIFPREMRQEADWNESGPKSVPEVQEGEVDLSPLSILRFTLCFGRKPIELISLFFSSGGVLLVHFECCNFGAGFEREIKRQISLP